MHLTDSHCHLDFPDFDADRSAVLARARALGVRRLVLPAVSCRRWPGLWQLVQAETGLYAALGLHPLFLDEHHDHHLEQLHDWLQRLAGDPRLCALGEFGLDYFVAGLDRQRQQQLFEAQLQLARAFRLPVLLHVRRAHAVAIATLKRLRPERGGIIHAFSGSAEEAREYLKLGFRLGFGGAASWPRAQRLRRLLAQLPDAALVLETDAPDMLPAMLPGPRNSPEYLPQICAALAEVRGQSSAQLAAISERNLADLFGWGEA